MPPKKRKYFPNLKQDHENQTSIGVEQALIDIRNSTADVNQSYNVNNTQIHSIHQIQNSIQRNNAQAVNGCTNLLLAAKKITSNQISDFQVLENQNSSTTSSLHNPPYYIQDNNKKDNMLVGNTVNVTTPTVSSRTITPNSSSSSSAILNENVSTAIKLPSASTYTKDCTKTTTPKNTTKRKRSKKAVSPTEIAKAKEIRMLRNRASAAAHRQRNRDLIETLQKEVELWKTKYDTAIDRQKSLELELQWWIKKHKNDTLETQKNQRQGQTSTLPRDLNDQTHLQKCAETTDKNVVNNENNSNGYEISEQKEERIKSIAPSSNLKIKINNLVESQHLSITENNEMRSDGKMDQQQQPNPFPVVGDNQHTLNNENDKEAHLLADQVNIAPIKRGPIWKKLIGVWSI